jgi:hypothetical protein
MSLADMPTGGPGTVGQGGEGVGDYYGEASMLTSSSTGDMPTPPVIARGRRRRVEQRLDFPLREKERPETQSNIAGSITGVEESQLSG